MKMLIRTEFIGLTGFIPCIFETTAFYDRNSKLDQWQERCDTYDDALEQHAVIVQKISDVLEETNEHVD